MKLLLSLICLLRKVFWDVVISYKEYLRLSKNATLIWISGYGDPYEVNLLDWYFDSNHTGHPEGKIFNL